MKQFVKKKNKNKKKKTKNKKEKKKKMKEHILNLKELSLVNKH
jgi:hypothetical protein